MNKIRSTVKNAVTKPVKSGKINKMPTLTEFKLSHFDSQALIIAMRYIHLDADVVIRVLSEHTPSAHAMDIIHMMLAGGKVPDALKNCKFKAKKLELAKYYVAYGIEYEKAMQWRKDHPPIVGGPSGWSMRSDSDWDRGITRCCCNHGHYDY